MSMITGGLGARSTFDLYDLSVNTTAVNIDVEINVNDIEIVTEIINLCED